MKLRVYLARLKRKIFKKSFIKDKRYPPYWIGRVLGNKPTFLIQIGSNDGKTGDPFYPLLQKHNTWQALFVEPVPYLFEQLKKNYPDSSRFEFSNVAINEGQVLPFYWVNPTAKQSMPDLPFWFDQLGSFDKQHIINELGDEIKSFIKSIEVKGMTLDDLLVSQEVSKIDILHIDTEGYDWKILSQLDLERYQPKFILYEQNHLGNQERIESISFLSEQYVLFESGIDIIAVHKSISVPTQNEMEKYFQRITKS